MALPLLLGVGMGILGGAQYLMKKADDREVQSMLPDAQGAIYNDPYGQKYGDIYERRLNEISRDDGGFFNADRAGEVRSLMDHFDQGAIAEQRYMEGLQLQRNLAWQDSNEGNLAGIQKQNETNQVRFGEIQNQRRNLDALYKGGDLSGVNLRGMINAVARMQFPDEALNQGDVDGIIQSSSILSQWANQVANLKGKADPELAKAIYNFGGDYYKGQQANFEAGERNVNDAVSRLRGQGYLPSDRVGRRFGTYDPEYQPQTVDPASGVGQSYDQIISATDIQMLIDAGMDPVKASQMRRIHD